METKARREPMDDRGICPTCGKQACEQFNDKPGPNGVTLAVPNGRFKCYWCGDEFEEDD